MMSTQDGPSPSLLNFLDDHASEIHDSLVNELRQHEAIASCLPDQQQHQVAHDMVAALRQAVGYNNTIPLLDTVRTLRVRLHFSLSDCLHMLCNLLRRSMFTVMRPYAAQFPTMVMDVLDRSLTNLALIVYQVYEDQLHTVRASAADHEEAYHTLIDHSLQGLAIMQDQGIVFANATVLSITGYSAAEIVAASPDELKETVHPDDRERVVAFVRERVEGTSVLSRTEYRIIRRDGAVRWIEAYLAPTRYRGRAAFQLAFVDITERKHVEEEMRRSNEELEQRVAERSAQLQAIEDRYCSVVMAMQEGVTVCDGNRTIIACNASAERILGLSSDQLIGERIFESPGHIIHADGSPFLPDDYPATITLNTGVPQSNIIMGLRKPEGSLTWISVNSQPLVHPGETHPYAVVTSFADITERKQAEEALRESQTRFSTLVESAPVAIFIIQDKLIQYMNLAAEKITGYLLHEMQLLDRNQVIHPESLTILEARRQMHQGAEPISSGVEIRIVTRDRRIRWLEITTTMIEFWGQESLVIFAQDVTERKRAEDAIRLTNERLEEVNRDLEQSRDLMRTIFDEVNDGLLLLDSRGSVLAANNVVAALLGYGNAENLVGQPWPQLCQPWSLSSHQDSFSMSPTFLLAKNRHEPIHNPDCQRFSGKGHEGSEGEESDWFSGEWIQQSLRDGCPRQRRGCVAASDQALRVFDIQALPVIHPSDGYGKRQRVEQVVLHIVDVTEHVQMEALMIENERFSTSRRLTEIVAHEVNTPLQTIMTSLETLERVGEDRRERFLLLAREEIVRISKILEQLKDLYRPNNDELSVVHLNQLIERVLHLTNGKLVKNAISVVCTLDDDLPPVWGRPDQLTQVLLNILINAIDAMAKGGLLTVQTRIVGHYRKMEQERPFLPSSSEHAASLVPGRSLFASVEVSDTGPGIDPAMQAQIFEPFYTTKTHGSGLGLPVSQKIVAEHEGFISFWSLPGSGSTFGIFLPVEQQAARMSPPERSADDHGDPAAYASVSDG